MDNFLIYGATGFVGEAIVRLAVKRGMQPIIAARNEAKIQLLADELNLEAYSFNLDDYEALGKVLKKVKLVLHCAGPYMHTYKNMVNACLRNKVHYLDITGEIPVFEAIAALDKEAKKAGIMLLPGSGFDVVPTDCMALYLKEHLPSGNKLTLAFCSEGPAGLPPGTAKTAIELLPYGNRIRKDGKLVKPAIALPTKLIDFGKGKVKATRLTWGDIFTAFHTTGIPNIEVYSVFPKSVVNLLKFMNLFNKVLIFPPIHNLLKKQRIKGSGKQERLKTNVSVWGQLSDEHGKTIQCRMHGPEAGVEWTSDVALLSTKKVLEGNFKPGYQTPALVFGADLVLECEGVSREEISWL